MGREGFQRHAFAVWARAKSVCKPRKGLLRQLLNFKRKWLQMHFASDAISLFQFSLEKDERIEPLRNVREDF